MSEKLLTHCTDPLVGGGRKSWSKGASIQTRLLGKPSLAIDGKFQHHHKYSFTRSVPSTQVFCLDKVGLIPLLRKLTGANQSLDREALWEAAETFHRLHQVLNSIKSPLCPPSPCSGGAVRTWWWRWWSVWTFLGFNRTQPCTPQSDQAESPCKYFF